MSMEIYLLSDHDVPSTDEWQRAIERLSFDVRVVDWETLPAGEIRLKAECQSKPVLMEITRVDLIYLRDTFPDVQFPEPVRDIHVLRWAMSFAGGAAAYQAAAAFLDCSKGLMIDTEEAKLKTLDEAVKLAREMALEMPALEAAVLALATKSRPKRTN